MNPVQFIMQKRNGQAHSEADLRQFIADLTSGKVESYQVAAWLMAVYFKGMNLEETDVFTQAMVESGDQIDLSAIEGIKVDKHSTGGVGDGTTLLVAPLVAAAGGKVAKMSGRGLGHTGGTLDKLESIPGLRVDLTQEQFVAQVQKIGLAVISQTGKLVPADGQLYAMRDVTATVDSIPLIAASVMSKKLACGAQAILLDVKYGDGAFMKEFEDAKALAKCMVGLGQKRGRVVRAALSSMEQPLGSQIGNALEVDEVLAILRGEIKQSPLATVAKQLAQQLIVMSNLAKDENEATAKIEQLLSSGQALDKLGQMIEAQGGDRKVTEDRSRLPQASQKIEVPSPSGGFVQALHAEKVGTAAMLLGAGRLKKSDPVDPAVGIVLSKNAGDAVSAGEPLAILHVNKTDRLDEARQLLLSAYSFGEQAPPSEPLIREFVSQP